MGLTRAAEAFVELAARSAFSLLDGACTPEALAERAAELRMSALGLADVFDLGGAVRFVRACEKAGVRPIVAGEILITQPGLRFGSTPATGPEPETRPRLVLLCENLTGYHNLASLVTLARTRGPRGSPSLSPADLRGRTSGLICLLKTEGFGSAPSDVAACLERFEALYPDRFILALEHHGLPADARRCADWVTYAERQGLSWVPVNAPRYVRPRDRIVHDVLTCLRHDTTLAEAGDLLLPNAEWHLKSGAQMVERWCTERSEGETYCGGVPPPCRCVGCRGVCRTGEIASRCTFQLADLRPRVPAFHVPGGRDSSAFLCALVEQGAKERYGERLGPAHRRQIEHELRVIGQLDLEDYFLIMWDVVRFANRNGILTQGRGSAANSAVCFCLGITAVDPIGLDLLFERFLSDARDEPPDIDLDIAHRDREVVLQYVYRKYGRAHAAMVCETITYRGKMAVRDAARVLGFSQTESDALSAEVDRGDAATAALRLAEGGLERCGLRPGDVRTRALLRVVRGLTDLPRHRSIHVGGFVLSDRPLGEIVPIEIAAMPDRTVIQWDKDDLDLPGFIKFDLLGLGMLTLLGDALRLVRSTRGVALDLAGLPPDDPVVYGRICAADTVGVFQIESRAQMNTLPRVQPRCFYDLVVEVALIRPGPIQGDMVHPYLRRRSGEEPVTYLDPRLEPLLARTLGVPLFQEQGMKVAIALAGFTPAQADHMRRAMGFKRSHRRMEEVSRDLQAGLEANGVAPDVIVKLMQYLTAFANYGFPESHAASFALLVYASAYLKHYFAPEFYASLLNGQPMGFYSPSTIVHDARRHSVEVRPVDLARSDWNCMLESRQGQPRPVEPALRLGLRLVRGLGVRARDTLRSARDQGPFRSVEDVVRRSGLGTSELRVLAEAGAFESLWKGRREALWELLRQVRGDAGPLARRLPEIRRAFPSLAAQERILADYRCMGLSAEGHPIQALREDLDRRGVTPAARLGERKSGEWVRVAGLVICRQRPGTAKGVMFITLEDETGFANFVVMPDIGEKHRHMLRRPLLELDGIVENEQGVINVLTRGGTPLSLSGPPFETRSRNFR